MWLTMKCTIYILVLLIAGTKASTSDDDHYIAGVVEFRPEVERNTSANRVEEHLAAYLQIINSPEANETDILVFPEDTLNDETEPTTVPDPTKGRLLAPCDDKAARTFQPFLVQLSCAARTKRKYIVIDLAEKVPCPDPLNDNRPCAPSGLNIYNTIVVFDREGRVISRYRKVNLFAEPLRNTTLHPELGVFDTDFGVRFGHFVCFDILFHTPSQELIEKYNMTDFIYPSYWFSELPFLTAVQMQQAWAWANNVNLLAAGASVPATGSSGSGIYAGNRGAKTALFASGPGDRKLLVATVPKIHSKNEMKIVTNENSRKSFEESVPEQTAERPKNLTLLRDPNLEGFDSSVINFNATHYQSQSQSLSRCAHGHCCKFDISLRPLPLVENAPHYVYRIGVFNDKRLIQPNVFMYLKICSVFACLDESITKCGYLQPDNVDYKPSLVFESIQINGGFSKNDKLLIMPSTLTDTLHGLGPHQMEFKTDDEGDQMQTSLRLTSELENLLTFGIYANYYDYNEKSAGKARDIPVTLLMCSLLIVFVQGSHWLSKRV